MDTTVTARVPVEIKEQGNQILKSIGATPTQLINAAYAFLLAEKKLPESQASKNSKPAGKRKLSKKQTDSLKKSISIMNLGYNGCDHEDFKSALNSARDERYAHIA